MNLGKLAYIACLEEAMPRETDKYLIGEILDYVSFFKYKTRIIVIPSRTIREPHVFMQNVTYSRAGGIVVSSILWNTASEEEKMNI